METEIAFSLRRVPFLADVAESDLSNLAVDSRLDHFRMDEAIFLQGDPTDRVWIVHDGRVKIVRQDETGREAIIEVIPPGEVFGGGAILLPAQPATARAMSETVETLSLSRSAYFGFLQAHPEVMLRLLRMLGGRLHSSIELSALAGERVERRLVHILLKLAGRTGRPDPEGMLISIPLSRQDLADMAGTTLETTIRLMSRFRRDGLVHTRHGGYLVIVDEQRLRDLARL